MDKDCTMSEREIKEEKKVRLSLHLMVKLHLHSDAKTWQQDKILYELNMVTHLRLDRQKIGAIDSLELLGGNVTNLYLQHNLIEKIENLNCLSNLSFLTLANNRITSVEGLLSLKRLLFLDLSSNDIANIDPEEIPRSVIILNFSGNPCTEKPNYRRHLVGELAGLRQLDEVEVTASEKVKAGLSVSSDSDSDSDSSGENPTAPHPHGHVVDPTARPPHGHGMDHKGPHEQSNTDGQESRELYQNTVSNMLMRSQDRLEESHKQHKINLHGLQTMRDTGVPATDFKQT